MFKFDAVFVLLSVFCAYLCFKTCFLNWMRTFMLWVKQVAFIIVKFIHLLCVSLANKSYVYPRISLSLVCYLGF